MKTNKLPKQDTEYPFKPNKGNTDRIVKTILIIFLIALLGYLSYDKGLKSYMEERDNEYYNYGRQELYLQLLQQLLTCEPLPLVVNNFTTVNAILVECLN